MTHDRMTIEDLKNKKCAKNPQIFLTEISKCHVDIFNYSRECHGQLGARKMKISRKKEPIFFRLCLIQLSILFPVFIWLTKDELDRESMYLLVIFDYLHNMPSTSHEFCFNFQSKHPKQQHHHQQHQQWQQQHQQRSAFIYPCYFTSEKPSGN